MTMKNISKGRIENILAKIDNEGFDYYMTDYAHSDFGGTILEPVLNEFLESRKKLQKALVDAGIGINPC